MREEDSMVAIAIKLKERDVRYHRKFRKAA
jgi:hypothetical protein